TIFDLNTVGSPERPEIRHDLPGGGRRLVTQAEGIKYTIINGQVLYEDRRHTGALPGQVLRAGQLAVEAPQRRLDHGSATGYFGGFAYDRAGRPVGRAAGP